MALSAQTPTPRPASLEDFLAIPAHERFHEMLGGEIVRKVMPTGKHGGAQRRLGALIDPYDDGSLRRDPGGWLLATEVEVLLPSRQVVRPDLVGWRTERLLELPDDFPVKLLPDWVCEVVSPSDPRRDTVIKYRDYARAGIPYYWLVDLADKSLTALRLVSEHYTVAAQARSGESVRAEPFEGVEIPVGVLFGEPPAAR